MHFMSLNTVKERLRRFLALDDTPERIAFGFAIGVFISFSPLLGLHTVLGILTAIAFGLNRTAVFTGLWVNNPWTLFPVYSAATYVGRKLIGLPAFSPSSLYFSELWHKDFWVHLATPVLKSLLLGSAIFAIIGGTFAYVIVLTWVRRIKSAR
jgi:uncharacterized protein (DUF2062 family)